ncbi:MULTISPECIES: dienelactone hydrolase family protein [unclassified Plantactinospora]|uniref:dienelactone hydrolase family protein n=1 Tax=unclassified Plantactinospora TaxID=2631981 RepID=UPI000D16B963|nr:MULTISPECIES: hydrolase [unclassified Plantactinospora]AVT31353.1 hydrolase [Plantactinospora sp. BC1]AVT39888.1 hydrolase [Plantactinospora sp. BB1]
MDIRTSDTTIPAGEVRLTGDLVVPADARGIILFAHGSGSSRHSPRNRMVAEALNRYALATVLVDLLTREEEAVDDRTGALRFDIGLLTGRLVSIVDWLATGEPAGRLPIGLFGASTGAAAALSAAAQRPDQVYAVVSRGGRPDLAGADLPRVRADTLLLVGGLDDEVLRLNNQALAELDSGAELRVVPGASHLFEEPGTLDRVARDAAEWFVDHLPPS